MFFKKRDKYILSLLSKINELKQENLRMSETIIRYQSDKDNYEKLSAKLAIILRESELHLAELKSLRTDYKNLNRDILITQKQYKELIRKELGIIQEEVS